MTDLESYNDAQREIRELRDDRDRLLAGIADIMRATIEGRVCDDVAWFDEITTLHDFCDLLLNPQGIR